MGLNFMRGLQFGFVGRERLPDQRRGDEQGQPIAVADDEGEENRAGRVGGALQKPENARDRDGAAYEENLKLPEIQTAGRGEFGEGPGA
jgi:hypothetical protein